MEALDTDANLRQALNRANTLLKELEVLRVSLAARMGNTFLIKWFEMRVESFNVLDPSPVPPFRNGRWFTDCRRPDSRCRGRAGRRMPTRRRTQRHVGRRFRVMLRSMDPKLRCMARGGAGNGPRGGGGKPLPAARAQVMPRLQSPTSLLCRRASRRPASSPAAGKHTRCPACPRVPWRAPLPRWWPRGGGSGTPAPSWQRRWGLRPRR